MRIDKPLILPIAKVVEENSRVKSFYFNYALPAKPGQILMIWVPGFDEKPFGAVVLNKETFMISVAAVGESTTALHAMQVGDKIGIRGPYGNGFKLPAEKGACVALIGGGYGMVPLGFLAKVAAEQGYQVDLITGARTADQLLMYKWLEIPNISYHIATDDGSQGFKGFVTDLFINYLKDNKPAKVFIVGPEIMEKKITDTCYKHSIPFQVSLERPMKCAFGICGQCSVDPDGLRMCMEGPAIDEKQLPKITEFGKYHRTSSGMVQNY